MWPSRQSGWPLFIFPNTLIKMGFKTRIKFGGYMATVIPILDQAVDAGNRCVGLGSPLGIWTLLNIAISTNEIEAELATAGDQSAEIAGWKASGHDQHAMLL
jgi:hypothetical protein